MGAFDPTQFLDVKTTEANSTNVQPCPEGEYIGMIAEDVTFKEIQSNKTGLTYIVAQIPFSIDDPTVTAVTDRSPTKVRYDLFVDFTETGALDVSKGKNVGLGRLREACGLNKPGVPFSFRDFTGKMCKIKVKHRTDGEKVFDEVAAVAPAQ